MNQKKIFLIELTDEQLNILPDYDIPNGSVSGDIAHQIIEQQKAGTVVEVNMSQRIINILETEYKRDPMIMQRIIETKIPIISSSFTRDSVFFCHEDGITFLGALNGILQTLGLDRVASKNEDGKLLGFQIYTESIIKEPATHVLIYSIPWNSYLKRGGGFTRDKAEAELYLRREAQDQIQDIMSNPNCKIMEPDDDMPAAR